MLTFTQKQKEEIEKLLQTKITINPPFYKNIEKIYTLVELSIDCSNDEDEFAIISTSKNPEKLKKIIENKINEQLEKTGRRFYINLYDEHFKNIFGIKSFDIFPNVEVWIFSSYRWEIHKLVVT